MTSGVDAVTRKRQMERLEQFVTVAMQDGHLGEAELLEKLKQFNQIVPPPLDAGDLELVARRLSERLNIDVDSGAVITVGRLSALASRRPARDRLGSLAGVQAAPYQAKASAQGYRQAGRTDGRDPRSRWQP